MYLDDTKKIVLGTPRPSTSCPARNAGHSTLPRPSRDRYDRELQQKTRSFLTRGEPRLNGLVHISGSSRRSPTKTNIETAPFNRGWDPSCHSGQTRRMSRVSCAYCAVYPPIFCPHTPLLHVHRPQASRSIRGGSTTVAHQVSTTHLRRRVTRGERHERTGRPRCAQVWSF